jgi:hypothetical protein
MTDQLRDVFETLDAAPLSARGLDAVRRRSRRIRRRRRGTAVLAACAAVAVVAGSMTQADGLLFGRRHAAPPARHDPDDDRLHARSPDGLLYLSDLGGNEWTGKGDVAIAPTTVVIPNCRPTGAEPTHVTFTAPSRRVTFRYEAQGLEGDASETVLDLPVAERDRLAAHLHAARTCALHGERLAASDDVLVTGTRVNGALGAITAGPIGWARTVALHGSTAVVLDVTLSHESYMAALPGQTRWLVRTTVLALDRATGVMVPAPPLTAAALSAARATRLPTAPGTPQPSLLTLADLGRGGGWSLKAAGSDVLTSSWTPVSLPACRGVPEPTAIGNGTTYTYRGWIGGRPDATRSNEWVLVETVLELDGTAAASARDAVRRRADCPTVVGPFGVMAPRQVGHANGADAARLVAAVRRPDGGIGYAEASIVRGTRFVQIDAVPGGARGNRALPGGLAWFGAVLDRAESRLR